MSNSSNNNNPVIYKFILKIYQVCSIAIATEFTWNDLSAVQTNVQSKRQFYCCYFFSIFIKSCWKLMQKYNKIQHCLFLLLYFCLNLNGFCFDIDFILPQFYHLVYKLSPYFHRFIVLVLFCSHFALFAYHFVSLSKKFYSLNEMKGQKLLLTELSTSFTILEYERRQNGAWTIEIFVR